MARDVEWCCEIACVRNLTASALPSSDLDIFEEEVLMNTITPVRVLRAFLPLVRQGKEKKLVFISSGMASIENAVYMPELSNSYSVAKAALNM